MGNKIIQAYIKLINQQKAFNSKYGLRRKWPYQYKLDALFVQAVREGVLIEIKKVLHNK